MIEKSIKERILLIISESLRPDGWAQQAAVCKKCKDKGIDLKEYGGAKTVFSQMSEYIEIRRDSNNLPTLRPKDSGIDDDCINSLQANTGISFSVTKEKARITEKESNNEPKQHEIRNAYRRLSKEPEEWIPFRDLIKELEWSGDPRELTYKHHFLQYNYESNSVRVHNLSKYEMLDDIYFDPKRNGFPAGMEKLREMTLDEKWDKGLLENYIKYTYARVKDENKITVSDDNLHACWNTGLVDYRYEPIFCYLTRKDANNRWMFKAFCIVGEDEGKEMNNNISKMPECAMYFKGGELLCQPTKENLSVDRDHIIREHPSRLPSEWLEQAIGEGSKWIADETPIAYDKRVSELLPKDSQKNFMLQTLLKQSIDESIKRCQWNYKTAIPYYDPNFKKLGWFLPLCIRETKTFEGKEKIQLTPFAALVVTKGKSGRFQGETIYNLSWAYRCARLVCRPDSDWLTPTTDDNIYDEDE